MEANPHQEKVEGLLLLHSKVFSGKLGRLQGVEEKLPVTEMTSPKFYRPRQVPYALRKKIGEELFDITKAGMIEPIHYLEWAVPIVPVLKQWKDQNLWRQSVDSESSVKMRYLSDFTH